MFTGGDSGIGKETAIELARRGARVILACRTTHRGIPAALEVQQRSGNGNVVYRNLDLCSQKSIHEFVKSFLKEESRLDVLINNAGKLFVCFSNFVCTKWIPVINKQINT